MSKRYTIPDGLGDGGEYEGVLLTATGDPCGRYIRLDVPGIGFVTLPESALTEVKPPLPEEPPVGAYMLGERMCMRTWPEPGHCHVYETGGLFAEDTFAKLWGMFGGPDVAIIPLVPALEPVSLPWEGRTGSSQPVAVTKTDDGWTYVEVAGKAVLVINEKYAAEMARALLTAAGDLP